MAASRKHDPDGNALSKGIVVPGPGAANRTTKGDPPAAPQIPSALGNLHHHMQSCLKMCDRLEEIADSLPDAVDTQFTLHTARSIYPTVKRAHEYEEQVLFPLFKGAEKTVEPLETQRTLQRLHAEHWEDESFAAELQEALVEFIRSPSMNKAETLGYMLRGFFEGMRRHIAFEMEHVLPEAQRIIAQSKASPA